MLRRTKSDSSSDVEESDDDDENDKARIGRWVNSVSIVKQIVGVNQIIEVNQRSISDDLFCHLKARLQPLQLEEGPQSAYKEEADEQAQGEEKGI